MKRKNYEKGITLIALVITIIILLILAGVTINIVINNGIINKSQTAVDKYTEEQAKEKLSLALFEYKMDKVTKKEGVNLQTKLSELGPVIEAEDTNYYEVEIDGYLFWVHKDTLEIISKGPSNPVPPTKIEFTETTDEANIGEGKNFNLKLKLEPQNANPKFLKWSVSDESVAKIQNGVLTGLKEGTVVVTVTSTEDASITASCTVTIKTIELTGITLNKTQLELGVNKNETLTVTYTPANASYKDIVWSTSDETIATVENGTIKGIAAGTATITATSEKNLSIKAECSVTVEELIEISTVEELKAFRDDVNNGNTYEGKKVVLTNDLDLNLGKYTVASDGTVNFDEDAEQWTAIGTATNNFKGSFDGKGHTISGLYINKPANKYQGLFGSVAGTSSSQKINIENIVLKDVDLYVANYSGGLVGEATYTKINKCAVTGKIKCTASNTATNAGGNIGGISGKISYSQISNCYNMASITASGNYCVGGIVAETLNRSVVDNCYNYGYVEGYKEVGGIIGNCHGSSSYCYNEGNVKGRSRVGGIIGISYGNLNNCYNAGEIQGNEELGGIIGTFSMQNNVIAKDSYYLSGTATTGIGKISNASGSYQNIIEVDSLPSPLSVLNSNGNDAWMEDENGNITLKFD